MQTARRTTITVFIALILLGVAWEVWLAPLRPGGSMLALKVLPLLLGLPAIARGSVRAYQWWSMGILAYLCEGVVRLMSDQGVSVTLAWIETGLVTIGFCAILAFVRAARKHAAS
jgi:uncharacterized membrane protein